MKSNRTRYTSTVTVTAREMGALARLTLEDLVVGDCALLDGVVRRLLANAKKEGK